MSQAGVAPTRMAHAAVRSNELDTGACIDPCALDGVLVDLDGVVTDTANVHAKAWKRMFDEFLGIWSARSAIAFEPYSIDKDYRIFVDGKPRYEGVASFLESRHINLSVGDSGDPPEKETICGLGNRKNRYFLETIRECGVSTYASSIDWLRGLKSRGLSIAVVTASCNGREVIEAAGIADLFDAQVDGVVARELALRGKPKPDTYLEAARRLGIAPHRAAVIEDAIAGVQAGKAGKFGLVIGVCRNANGAQLRQNGADFVVSDLSQLLIASGKTAAHIPVPFGREHMNQILARVHGRRVAVFLDYDGTLTPIVERPELAILTNEMHGVLRALSNRCPVIIISGRERENLAQLVALDQVIYAGCHGFDIDGAPDIPVRHKTGSEFLPVIRRADRALRDRLAGIAGALVEGKSYAVAVHYRLVSDEDLSFVHRIVDEVLSKNPSLCKTGGKKVIELRPNIDWNKGKAVQWLLHALDLDQPNAMPLYFGDDLTDEDAFRVLRGTGVSFLVAAEPQSSSADYRLTDVYRVQQFLRDLTTKISELDQ